MLGLEDFRADFDCVYGINHGDPVSPVVSQSLPIDRSGDKWLNRHSATCGSLISRRRFGTAFVRVEPVEDVFERRDDYIAVIAAGDFDVFDLDA